MDMGKKETIRLGKVVNTVGLKGEVRIYPYTDYKEKFEELSYVIIDEKAFTIKNVRYVKNMAILRLSDVDSQEKAQALKEKEVFILKSDAPPLPSDTYYVKDLIGLKAEDEEGRPLGIIREVVIGAAQDIYMVEPFDEGDLFPVPAVSEFVKNVDLEKGVITMKLIEGLVGL